MLDAKRLKTHNDVSINVSICGYDKHHGSVMVNSEWASTLQWFYGYTICFPPINDNYHFIIQVSTKTLGRGKVFFFSFFFFFEYSIGLPLWLSW